MNKILVVVDFQNDFVDPSGVLPVPGATAIWQNIQDRINSGEYAAVVYTFDTHTPSEYNGSDEQKLFPNIHCEFGTAGWNFFQIVPQNNAEFQAFIKTLDQPFVMVTLGNEFFFTKNVFDIWQGNAVYETWFPEQFPVNEVEVDVVGVAHEYCVNMNVRGMLSRGYKVNFLTNCVKSITPEGEQESVRVLTENGAKFV